MSFLDKLNQAMEPFRKLIRNNPIYNMISQPTVTVSFTDKQTGERNTAIVEYIGQYLVLYLFFSQSDVHWKALVQGAPISLSIGGDKYSGWAEDLKGYDEFFEVLSKDTAKQADLIQRFGPFTGEDYKESPNFKQFIEQYKLIRVKISR
jgi:hypothetical protein